MQNRHIAFSPPDVGEAEIGAVADALRSGWITTGPRTKELEGRLKEYTEAAGFVCLNSATAALECCLRALGVGPGDEVIVPAYTYTASCSVICHVGATPVLCDTEEGSFQMDYEAMGALIGPRTKVIIPVDLAGRMCDYGRIFAQVEAAKGCWQPTAGTIQECFGRVIVLADAAHALGATYHGRPCGSVADFTAFSFHAVKNFTTAEGGGLSWRDHGFDNDEFYRQLMLLSLHGQTKDALAKNKPGAWEYDIAFPGWKCNMTDLQAAIGLVQLARYPQLLRRRRQILERYQEGTAGKPVEWLVHYDSEGDSSGHLAIVRLIGKGQEFRNRLIEAMAERGVATNVHYKPLPLLTAYKDMGFSIDDYPHALAQFENEVTLPLHTLLSDDDVEYVLQVFSESYERVEEEFDRAEAQERP